LLGGRIAEELIFNDLTTGAAGDIKQATELARKMVTDYGMSDKLGPRTFGDKQEMVFLGREISEQKDYGEKVAKLIDEEVSEIIQHAYEISKGILTKNKPQLIRIAQKLIAEETLEGKELDTLFSEATPEPAPETTVTPVPETVEATTKTKPRAKKAPATPETSPGLP